MDDTISVDHCSCHYQHDHHLQIAANLMHWCCHSLHLKPTNFVSVPKMWFCPRIRLVARRLFIRRQMLMQTNTRGHKHYQLRIDVPRIDQCPHLSLIHQKVVKDRRKHSISDLRAGVPYSHPKSKPPVYDGGRINHTVCCTLL